MNWRLAAAMAAPFGAYGWAIFAMAFHHDGVIAPHVNVSGVDYIVFYEAIRSYFAHDLRLLGDAAAFLARENADFRLVLSHPLAIDPWVYPPPFLLLLLPFGLLPFWASYAVFMLATFALACAAARLWSPGWRDWAIWVAALACAPATAATFVFGQNALLTLALLLGGFGLVERGSGFAGGLVLGVLAYKPQYGAMIPFALLARGQWRAIAGAATGVLAICAASLAVFGLGPWRDWLAWVQGGDGSLATWAAAASLSGWSVYSCAMHLGAARPAALAAQGLALAGAAAAVVRAGRRESAADLRCAVLLAATFIASPHALYYDAVLLAGAALLLWRRCRAGHGKPVPLVLAVLLWLVPYVPPPFLLPTGYAVPVLVAAVLACLVWRPAAQPRVPA